MKEQKGHFFLQFNHTLAVIDFLARHTSQQEHQVYNNHLPDFTSSKEQKPRQMLPSADQYECVFVNRIFEDPVDPDKKIAFGNPNPVHQLIVAEHTGMFYNYSCLT